MATSARTNGRRPRVLFLNQYYWPAVEATATLLTDLCEALAETYDMTVVTGVTRGHEGEPLRTERNGVEIVRVPSTAFERSRLAARAANYVTYLGYALRESLRVSRPDIVACMTDPPMVGDVGLVVARRYRVPLLVISQDVFPEIALELKRLENPLLVGILRQLVDLYLRRSDRIVAIGESMRRRLIEKGAPPDRVAVIPNWVDTREISPQPRDNDWARANDLVGKFVVMHSGNVGHAQNLDALIRAASFLRDLDDLRIVVVGFGARYAASVELAERLEIDSILFLPYQPRDVLPFSLSSADLHYIGLGKGLSGYIVPSRFYGTLAVSRPVLAAADPESETAQIVEQVQCGVTAPPDRPDLIAAAIRRAHAGELPLDEMGRRGLEYAHERGDRSVAVQRYRQLFDEMLP